jgi:hypothetical protein
VAGTGGVAVSDQGGRGANQATSPRRLFFALDRVFYRPDGMLAAPRILTTDHLPCVAAALGWPPESVLDGEVGWSRDTRRALLREDGFSNGTEEWDLRLAGLRSKPSLLERDTHPTVNH